MPAAINKPGHLTLMSGWVIEKDQQNFASRSSADREGQLIWLLLATELQG